ncbi:MAG: tRNA-(ms[2]io[6]A)-hydroxylase [Deltaproteobacteria bacterium]|nr:MAG: tRNA-(ms[2]io[6]A)-hydroxylase [Deltaproteobacteria bacterium]
MLRLRSQTPSEWIDIVRRDLPTFLRDHAHNERKVSQSALALAKDNPERVELTDAMVDLAAEELDHFRQVYVRLRERGLTLGFDRPDPYMTAMRKLMRKHDTDLYLLDRLVLFSIIEARGFERFHMMAEALPEDDPLKAFYRDVARDEALHRVLFLKLAKLYFPEADVDARLDELLEEEAKVLAILPLRASVH